jgi:predicted dehydrogenase
MPVLATRDDVEFTGVCRLGEGELRQVQQKFGFPYATEDYRALLADCELDAVVVSSPHTLHFEHARAALEKGLHVMCEKPFTTRASEARELVRLAEEKGLHLLVPYGWHYKPFLQQARELVAQGALGRIEHVMCHMASPVRELLSGKPVYMDNQSGQSNASLFQPASSTWADPQVAGGGYGHAQVSHSSGMLFWITGLRAQEVFSLMSAPGAQVDLYDALTVRFTNGAIGTVSGAGTVPTSQGFQVDIRIFGDEGMLLLDCERARMKLSRHDGKQVAADIEAAAGQYDCQGPPHNFVDLVLGKTAVNHAPGEAAMRSVELLDAAYRSAVSGRLESVA